MLLPKSAIDENYFLVKFRYHITSGTPCRAILSGIIITDSTYRRFRSIAVRRITVHQTGGLMKFRLLVLSGLFMSGTALFAQTSERTINSGDTAWMLIATALVMFMTVPALALFYGGLVKRKNVLSILMQCFITLALVSVIWVICGYSLSFSPDAIIPGFLGNLKWSFLTGVSALPSDRYATTVPHLLFMIFQGMFAVITPALIAGAFAERMKFSAYIAFTVGWLFLVYFPVTHWVWSTDGWLYKMGVLDFAGGIVVHITAGITALVTSLIIGRRSYLKPTPPHNLPFTMVGAAMLWFGWFGFNAGSALGANGIAASTFVVTNTSASIAVLTWILLDRIHLKSPTMLGAATGAIAGLAAITPASGYVDIKGALIIGAVSSICCFYMVVFVKSRFRYDDSLDAFGVHGIGGIIGTIATGLFATPFIQKAYTGAFFGNVHQLYVQLVAVIAVVLYTGVVSFILYKVIDKIIRIRVTEGDEAIGLDVTQHNERGYTIIE
jgi:Amt family ammonium transporter